MSPSSPPCPPWAWVSSGSSRYGWPPPSPPITWRWEGVRMRREGGGQVPPPHRQFCLSLEAGPTLARWYLYRRGLLDQEMGRILAGPRPPLAWRAECEMSPGLALSKHPRSVGAISWMRWCSLSTCFGIDMGFAIEQTCYCCLISFPSAVPRALDSERPGFRSGSHHTRPWVIPR